MVRWLASHLEPERIYTEPEINAFVHQFHPDVASLRRYFIDHKLMARERGIYWRIDKPKT